MARSAKWIVPLALSFAWLAESHMHDSHDSHHMAKVALSMEDGQAARTTMRRRLQDEADTDTELAELLSLEKTARGGDDTEPNLIACRGEAMATLRDEGRG